MLKQIFTASIFLITSLNASADFIYANDFSVGQNVSQLTDNATLKWRESKASVSDSTIFSPGSFYNQHFGGLTSATTYDTFPALYNESRGSPNLETYAALEINFSTAVRSFGFKAENHSGSPFGVFLYDPAGNFIKMLQADVTYEGSTFPQQNYDLKINNATYNYNFDMDVGKIRIGGTSDGGYIYALNVNVPEPSTLTLFLAGLFSTLMLRRVKLS